MGRTIPSFRLSLAEEESDWNLFRNRLDRSERKDFDRMFSIPRLYLSACSYAVKPIRIQPILMSMIFHHYKLLIQSINQIEHVKGKRYDSISR
jgi:hypothetical protein